MLCKGRIDKMTSAGEIEKRFRNNPVLFTLKKHEAAKSDAWKYFSLSFEKQVADSGSLTEVKSGVKVGRQ